MTRTHKLLMVAGALAVTVVAGWLFVIAAAYALGGVMTVEVVEPSTGRDLYLPVPMALLDLAVVSIPSPAIHSAGLGALRVDGMGVDLGELGPVLLGLLEELDRMPDATLVEVVDGRSSVRIGKSGSKLLVEVDEPGRSLDFAVPTRGVLRLADRLID